MRARYYDPQLGRFISEDPIGLEGGINTFAFAGNDPVNFSDPYGLEPESAQIQCDPGYARDVDVSDEGITISCIRIQGRPLETMVTVGRWDPFAEFVNGVAGRTAFMQGAADAIGEMSGGYDGVRGVDALLAGEVMTGAALIYLALPTSRAPAFAKNSLPHIFRSAGGHVNPARLTSQNRYMALFQTVGSNPANLRPDMLNPFQAQAGVSVFTQTFNRGQVWVWLNSSGEIYNAGVNRLGSIR